MTLSSEDTDLTFKTEEMIENIDSPTLSELTKNSSSEPLQILLFPPKNKQFRFDEETKSIEIQSIDPPSQIEANGTCQPDSEEKFECVNNETTLTPAVENILLSDEGLFNHVHSTPIRESCEKGFSLKHVLKIETVFKESSLRERCFLKGCRWSPDGLCLLSNSEDNVLRLFEFSEVLLNNPEDDISPVLQVKEGGTIYDYKWYPKMDSSDPLSCVFASTSQDSPIHLWDAYTGLLRATYQPINQYDEVTSAYSLGFSPDGSKLYSGFRRCLRIFDISQPGRISEERNLKTKGDKVYQTNIISSISINPAIHGLYSLGSYDRSIGIYAEPVGDLICILRGHTGGITQLMFSSDGNYLLSGGRKDQEILCWDVRNPGKVVFTIERKVDTQQKIQFDLSPSETYLATGTTNGFIKIIDIKSPTNSKANVLEAVETWKGHEDCVNGVHFHPTLPVLASSSGQRHLPLIPDDDDDEEDDQEEDEGNEVREMSGEQIWSSWKESLQRNLGWFLNEDRFGKLHQRICLLEPAQVSLQALLRAAPNMFPADLVVGLYIDYIEQS